MTDKEVFNEKWNTRSQQLTRIQDELAQRIKAKEQEERHEANLKTVEEGFQRAFGPLMNHGVVDLAEKTYYPGKMPPVFNPSPEPMAIIRMTEGLEEELHKQSKTLGMTQLIAIIALAVAVIALLT